jgi:hypothetical protein
MLLVEITINAVVNRVSIDGHGLTYNWRPRIIGFDAPTLAIPSDHGGFARMTFGTITFNPLLFATDWPPPVSCPITIYYTDTTEAAKETLFVGTAHLQEFDRERITYALFGPSYDETIAASTVYSDTLNVVLTAILTVIPEITTVNTTYARASSPNVAHTLADTVLAIDLASGIAEFYSHLFYVVGTTAYLVDMKLSNGADWTLTEFGFMAFPVYRYKPPLALITSSQYRVFSAYPYGTTLDVTPYHTTQANIETAITDILAIENAPRVTLDVPMIAGNFPNPGRKIILPDTAHVADLSSWIRARKIRYDFISDMVNLEGEGTVAAG